MDGLRLLPTVTSYSPASSSPLQVDVARIIERLVGPASVDWPPKSVGTTAGGTTPAGPIDMAGGFDHSARAKPS
jgi:hypothetical protein